MILILYLKALTRKTLIAYGAKINLSLQQLILPIKLSMAEKHIGLKIITPKLKSKFL